ncbi:MAG: large subunit ribosomal protein L25 [Candidatus Paceibacteria bacterium]|jgi:large subunit ribosomal protein L25
MASSQVLSADKRSTLGTKASRAMRADGRIPANIQGGGEHIDISIDEREFLASRRAHVHLYDIEVDGSPQTAVVNELQWDTFGDRIQHVEFRAVVRGVELESSVALVFVGNPKGGVANHLLDELLVRCIPSLIPDNLEVSVDGLEEHQHVKAKDIVMPEGISLACDPEIDVVTIIGAGGGEAPAAEDEEGEEGGETPTA